MPASGIFHSLSFMCTSVFFLPLFQMLTSSNYQFLLYSRQTVFMTVNEPHFMTAWCSLLIQSERKYFFWRCRRSRLNRICLSKLDSVIIVSIMNVSNDRLCIIQFRFVLTSIQFYFCALWTSHRNAFFHLHKHIWFNLEFSFRFFFFLFFRFFVLIFFSFFSFISFFDFFPFFPFFWLY